MSWEELLLAFLVSHVVGDFLLQTDWQARHKARGLGRDPTARRALLSHVLTYTLAFVPALVWIADERSAAGALGLAALIAVPHIALDDKRFVLLWLRRVKRNAEPTQLLFVAVDQSFHLIALFGAALLATA